MRGTIENIKGPYTFGSMLPAVYQQDEFTMRFISAFDVLVAPILAILDNQEYYMDPKIVPLDILVWLAGWVGLDELDETWPEESKRDLVAHATELFAIRGTIEGLRRHLAIYIGVEPVVEESGGCAYSAVPNGELPGNEISEIVVKIPSETPRKVHAKKIDMIVKASKPAHMAHSVIFED